MFRSVQLEKKVFSKLDQRNVALRGQAESLFWFSKRCKMFVVNIIFNKKKAETA
jgi:hypothetical protein